MSAIPQFDESATLTADSAGTTNRMQTVLLVEDDTAVANLLRLMLSRDGFQIAYAADGREAQHLIATLPPPAFVLLDIMLPYADGFELIANVRTQPGWEKIPLMMLTAMGSEKDIARALDLGADDYMIKPFQPAELKARVRRILRIRS